MIFSPFGKPSNILDEEANMQKIYGSELPYPEIVVEKNIPDSKLLMPSYGGPSGEATAIMTYSFQHFITEQDELASALIGIAITEMKHFSLLGECIYRLGGYPIVGGRTYWNGSFVNYTLDKRKFLEQNIMAEETAILNYERTILNLSQESVKLLLERIILDEEVHIKIFKELLNGL